MRRQFSHLMLKSGVLYRSMQLEDDIVEHLIIPESCRIEVLRGLHNDMGHPGRDRMLRLMRERYYWPGMFFDVAEWVDKCDRCIRRKSAPQKAPLVNITTTYPLEMVCFDFLTISQSLPLWSPPRTRLQKLQQMPSSITSLLTLVFHQGYILTRGQTSRAPSSKSSATSWAFVKPIPPHTILKVTLGLSA